MERIWSDTKCLALVTGKFFPAPTADQTLLALKEFAAWLFYPQVPVKNLADLVIRVALLAETPDGEMFLEEHMANPEIANLTLDWGSQVNLDQLAAAQTMSVVTDHRGANIQSLCMAAPHPLLILPAGWYAAVTRLDTGPRSFRKVICFLALFLTRAAVKSKQSIMAYWRNSMVNTVESLFKPGVFWVLPHLPELAVDLLIARLQKNNVTVHHLHAACICTQVKAFQATPSRKDIISVLQASCLLAISNNGLALVALYYDAVDNVPCDANELLVKMITEKTMHSVSLMFEFLSEVADPIDTRCYSWPYCRYLDDTIWADLAIAKNKHLGAILAAIRFAANPEANRDVWQMAGLANLTQAVKETAIELACGITEGKEGPFGEMSEELKDVRKLGARRARRLLGLLFPKRRRASGDDDGAQDGWSDSSDDDDHGPPPGLTFRPVADHRPTRPTTETAPLIDLLSGAPAPFSATQASYLRQSQESAQALADTVGTALVQSAPAAATPIVPSVDRASSAPTAIRHPLDPLNRILATRVLAPEDTTGPDPDQTTPMQTWTPAAHTAERFTLGPGGASVTLTQSTPALPRTAFEVVSRYGRGRGRGTKPQDRPTPFPAARPPISEEQTSDIETDAPHSGLSHSVIRDTSSPPPAPGGEAPAADAEDAFLRSASFLAAAAEAALSASPGRAESSTTLPSDPEPQ